MIAAYKAKRRAIRKMASAPYVRVTLPGKTAVFFAGMTQRQREMAINEAVRQYLGIQTGWRG